MNIGVEDPHRSPYLERILKSQKGASSKDIQRCDAVLRYIDGGLDLYWRNGTNKVISLRLNYLGSARRLRSFPAPKQGAFNQALGKKSKRILDLSGGFGGDSLLMSLQGYQVTVVERIPLMAVLIEEAFERLAQQDWPGREQWHLPTVINQQAQQVISGFDDAASEYRGNSLVDCAYFDPMFPSKPRRSAASNKYMQFLQKFAGQDDDAAELAQSVINAQLPRLCIKRPNYADPLIVAPNIQFSSKLVHYDVYHA